MTRKLSLNMLNCFKDYKRYIHFLNISYIWLDPSKWNQPLNQKKMLSIQHSQNHACWCTGDFRSQCISRHGIDPLKPEYSVSIIRRFRTIKRFPSSKYFLIVIHPLQACTWGEFLSVSTACLCVTPARGMPLISRTRSPTWIRPSRSAAPLLCRDFTWMPPSRTPVFTPPWGTKASWLISIYARTLSLMDTNIWNSFNVDLQLLVCIDTKV